MKLSPQQYARALFEALAQSPPEDHDLVLDKFVKILAQNDDLELFENIAREFENFSLNQQGKSRATLTTAKNLKPDPALLNSLNKIAGKKLQITARTDEKLIGGLTLRIDDILIDASLKGQLNNLNAGLSK